MTESPSWKIQNNKLKIMNREVPLPGIPIKMVDIEDTVLVLCEDPGNSRNVFLLNNEGELVWQIQASPSSTQVGYKKIFRMGDEFLVIDFEENQWLVNVTDGKIKGAAKVKL